MGKRIRRSKRSTKGFKKPVFDPSDVVNASSTSQHDDDSDVSMSEEDDCIDTNDIKINRSSTSPDDELPLSKLKPKQKNNNTSSSKGSKESPKITFLPVERRKCARPGCNNFSMNDKIYCSNECILRFAQMTKGNTAEMHSVPQPEKKMIIKPKYSKPTGNSGRLMLSPNSLPAKPSMIQGRKILIKRKGTDQVVQSLMLTFEDVKGGTSRQLLTKTPATFQPDKNSPKRNIVAVEDPVRKNLKKIKPYKPARQSVEE